jgi:hypothetical protein
MAPAHLLSSQANDTSAVDHEGRTMRIYRRLGLVNGLLIGLALVASIWVPQALELGGIPTPSPYGSMLVAALPVVLLCTLIGWGTARMERTVVTMIVWFAASIVITLLVAYQPNWLRSFVVWLVDTRFWGRTIYPAPEALLGGRIVSGFLVIGVLTFLGIAQDYRLEGIQSSLGRKGRATFGTIARFLLPLFFVAVAGVVTGNIFGSAQTTVALSQTDEVFRTGRTYEGNLFELDLETGLRYSAIKGVRDQMSANYTLLIGEIDPLSSTVFVVAHFDNGAWINCRVLDGALQFCYDASLPYTVGLASLITGEPVPEDCRGCLPRGNETLFGWLRQQGRAFSGPPLITRLAQQGSHVLMRAESPDGSAAVECWFEGNNRVELVSCSNAE